MSSVHRLPGKPNWVCFYTDREGRRRCRSTLTTDKKAAVRVCNEVQKIEDLARSGALTPDRARRVIEGTVSSIMESLGSPLERATVHDHLAAWLKSFEAEASQGTFDRYRGVVSRFELFLGAKKNAWLSSLRASDIQRYRDSLVGNVAPRTVNTHLKVLRVALEIPTRQGVFDRNPARLVSNVNTKDQLERRAFTLPELKRLLAVASDDWKTAIMIGIYCGFRLGDIAEMTWANVDLGTGEIVLTTQKTGRTQILPIAPPLRRHIEQLPAGDDPRAPLCPQLAGRLVNVLSNQFYELMASAGLVASRGPHRAKKKGRGMRRVMSEISFHSLRHTATSLLKNAGVSDAVARDIIGHESAAVSRNYSHIDTDAKRSALGKLPDITG